MLRTIILCFSFNFLRKIFLHPDFSRYIYLLFIPIKLITGVPSDGGGPRRGAIYTWRRKEGAGKNFENAEGSPITLHCLRIHCWEFIAKMSPISSQASLDLSFFPNLFLQKYECKFLYSILQMILSLYMNCFIHLNERLYYLLLRNGGIK